MKKETTWNFLITKKFSSRTFTRSTKFLETQPQISTFVPSNVESWTRPCYRVVFLCFSPFLHFYSISFEEKKESTKYRVKQKWNHPMTFSRLDSADTIAKNWSHISNVFFHENRRSFELVIGFALIFFLLLITFVPSSRSRW